MKSQLFAAAALAAVAAAGAAQAAEVQVKDAVARVVVIPENRQDVDVSVVYGKADLPKLSIRKGMHGETIVDGGLERKIRGCSAMGLVATEFTSPTSPPENLKAHLRDHEDVRIADAPLITIRTPMDVDVKVGGAVFGAIGRAKNVEFGDAGCGDWTVANVDGAMSISLAGSGDIRTGSAGAAHIRLAGSGDVITGSVTSLEAELAGSGDVRVRSVKGPVKAKIAGSGDIVVESGRTEHLEAAIAGSGDVRFAGEAQTVKASILGSGDVRVAVVNGEISKSVMGSGSVTVGK
jgi:hypothetical protein